MKKRSDIGILVDNMIIQKLIESLKDKNYDEKIIREIMVKMEASYEIQLEENKEFKKHCYQQYKAFNEKYTLYYIVIDGKFQSLEFIDNVINNNIFFNQSERFYQYANMIKKTLK